MNSAAPAAEEAGETRPDSTASQMGTGRSLVPVTVDSSAETRRSGFGALGRQHGLVAAGAAVAMGLAFIAGTALLAGHPQNVVVAEAAHGAVDPTADALVRVQGEVRALKASLDGLRSATENGRQDETIRGLKRGIETLKADFEGMKTASTTAVGQIGAKLDKLDRDPGAKLADMTARLDRIEKQVSAADTTGSLPSQQGAAASAALKTPAPPQHSAQAMPPAPPPVAVVPPVRPETVAKPEPVKIETAKAEQPVKEPATHQEPAARPATVEGWMLRDVYGGVALLEGRGGGLREVMPGEYIPGVGEIRSIERRGRGWVVVTSRGLIQADNRW